MTDNRNTFPSQLRAAPVSYRQLDYWIMMGFLHAPSGGTGRPRQWTNEELRVAVRMAKLVEAGLTPKAAAKVARQPGDKIRLTSTVVLSFERN